MSYAAVRLTGAGTLLRHAAAVKPYAPIFQTAGALCEAASEDRGIIVFLGDSSVSQPPWADPGAPGIPALLQAELGGTGECMVADWSYPAATFFDYYCLLFEARRYSPSVVIIPINWRNLGPLSWERAKPPAFPELSAAVPLTGAGTPSDLLDSKGIGVTQRLVAPAHRPMLYLTGLRGLARTKAGFESDRGSFPRDKMPSPGELAALLSDARLFSLYAPVQPGDEQVEALCQIARAARPGGPRLLFYMTPIHMEEMRKRSARAAEAVLESTDAVAALLVAEGAECVNLAGILSECEFIDTAEHYTAEGNRKIARALAPAVRGMLTPAALSADYADPR
jgi:hypothetical protein